MADEEDLEAMLGVAPALLVNLCDQRTRCIDDLQRALPRFHIDRVGDAVRAEDRRRAGWDLVERLDEHSALGTQALDDVLVVDDFVADIDGRSELLKRALDDIYGALDAGAKAARLGQNNSQRARRSISHGDTHGKATTPSPGPPINYTAHAAGMYSLVILARSARYDNISFAPSL